MVVNRSKTVRHLGFTLLELVVAIAILGILVAVAVPFYQDYVIRSRVAEAYEFADASRTQIADRRTGSGDASLSGNFDVLNKPVDQMTRLQWVAVPAASRQADTVIGYLLPSMNIKGLGARDAFALELRNDGQWRCVNAALAAGRNQVSANKALEDKYLVETCRSGSGLMAQNAKLAMGCPAGSQQVQTPDAAGKMQWICQSGTSYPQPTLQPGLQPQAQPQAQAFKKPLLSPQLQPGFECPAGHDCSQKDPKCPAGQGYLEKGDRVFVRNTFDPSLGRNIFSVTLKVIPPGCAAKCRAGFTYLPGDPTKCGIAPATNNHICKDGAPKFICERAHVAQVQCPVDAPFAATHVENLQDGSRYVLRSCVTTKEAYEYAKYNAAHPECANYSVDKLQPSHFTCNYACLGDHCNDETVPRGQPRWNKEWDDKDELNLPSNFEQITGVKL